MAVLALLLKNGLKTAGFKIGPDFIDPMFHSFILNKPSYNLDSFMLDRKNIEYLFYRHMDGNDVSVVEGVMGLNDGLGDSNKGSTAEIAEILNLPVILVVNAKGMSRSIAPVITGFENFNKKIKIAGVILNNVSSIKHYEILKKILSKETKIKCLGYLEKDEKFAIQSRHLGLFPVEEIKDMKEKIAGITLQAEKALIFTVF